MGIGMEENVYIYGWALTLLWTLDRNVLFRVSHRDPCKSRLANNYNDTLSDL